MTQANWIHCHFCQRKRSSAATFEREVYKDRPIECEDLCGISVCFYLPEPWQMPVAQAHVFHDCILRVVFSFFIQWQKAFAHLRDIKQTYVRYKFCLLSAFRRFLALSPRDSLCSLRLFLRALEMN